VTGDELQRAWVAQAQAEAERGVLHCRMCRRHGPLDEAFTLWRNGVLVFAVCERCACSHDVLIRPTEAGIEVRGRARTPLALRSSP
jgi:hypothetical protein